MKRTKKKERKKKERKKEGRKEGRKDRKQFTTTKRRRVGSHLQIGMATNKFKSTVSKRKITFRYSVIHLFLHVNNNNKTTENRDDC